MRNLDLFFQILPEFAIKKQVNIWMENVDMQRTVDIVLSGIALLLLALFLLVVCVLKVTGEGEIFSHRVESAVVVNTSLYKFATMLKDSQNMGTGTVTVKDDPHITHW